jgi:predicted dehydrogenase
LRFSCHFFDLMRLITEKECLLSQMQATAQRGINYQDEPHPAAFPIIDAAYVTMPWASSMSEKESSSRTMSCLELCMYADGSRHQEEVIVTGTKGRLEAYLPENKVYSFQRPSPGVWTDRSVPPPPGAIKCQIWDCSDAADVHHADPSVLPKHGGYHYGSTAVEWYKLLSAVRYYEETDIWKPLVSLEDGIQAVEMGLQATRALIINGGN